MATQGTAVVDFGTGAVMAQVVVTGQAGIVAGSLVEAWPNTTSTSNNLTDAILVEELQFYAGDIIAGTGFTIYAMCRFGSAFGKFTTSWVWN